MFLGLMITAAFRSRWRYGFRTNALSLRNFWSRAVTRMRATLSRAQRPCRRARRHCLRCGTFLPRPRASVCPPTATCPAIRIGTPLLTRTRCRDHRWCELSEGNRYPRVTSEQGKEDLGWCIRTQVIKPGWSHLQVLSLLINLAAWGGRPHLKWMIFSKGTSGFMRLLQGSDFCGALELMLLKLFFSIQPIFLLPCCLWKYLGFDLKGFLLLSNLYSSWRNRVLRLSNVKGKGSAPQDVLHIK